jgi:hypothetical protein
VRSSPKYLPPLEDRKPVAFLHYDGRILTGIAGLKLRIPDELAVDALDPEQTNALKEMVPGHLHRWLWQGNKAGEAHGLVAESLFRCLYSRLLNDGDGSGTLTDGQAEAVAWVFHFFPGLLSEASDALLPESAPATSLPRAILAKLLQALGSVMVQRRGSAMATLMQAWAKERPGTVRDGCIAAFYASPHAIETVLSVHCDPEGGELREAIIESLEESLSRLLEKRGVALHVPAHSFGSAEYFASIEQALFELSEESPSRAGTVPLGVGLIRGLESVASEDLTAKYLRRHIPKHLALKEEVGKMLANLSSDSVGKAITRSKIKPWAPPRNEPLPSPKKAIDEESGS